MMKSIQIHASCVAAGSRGVVLLGEAGSGKSDLALRLIDRGAVLVGDDRVDLHADEGCLIASPTSAIAGLIEARGLGILKQPVESEVPVYLAVQLVDREQVERLPRLEYWYCLDVQIPMIRLHPFDISAPLRVEMALACLQDQRIMHTGALKMDSIDL